MDEIKKIPPVTRYLIGGVLLVTVPTLLELVAPYAFVLYWPYVTQKREVWRLLTCFLYGGKGLGFLFALFMLFKNSMDLEQNAYFRSTSRYAWALLMNALLIIALNHPLKTMVLFGPLLNAVIWLWSRANMHSSTSFFGFVTIPAPYLPYVYLALDLLQGGLSSAVQSATGLLAGFLWTQIQLAPEGQGPFTFLAFLAQPPAFFQRWLPDSTDPALGRGPTPTGGAGRSTPFGQAYAPRNRSFGDAAAGGGAGQGRTINSTAPGTAAGGGLLARLGLGSRGTGARAASGGSAGNPPTREDILAAAERRLQAQADASIIGRHRQSQSQPQSQVGTAAGKGKERATPEAAAGSTSSLPAGQTARSSALRDASSSQSSGSRNRTNGGGNGGGMSFAELAARAERAKGDDAEQEDASGSGGRVAEQRRPGPGPAHPAAGFGFGLGAGQQPPKPGGSGAGAGGAGGTGHAWGQGRPLGE